MLKSPTMSIRVISMVAGGGFALAVVWLVLGSRIVSLTDRIFPGPEVSHEVGDLMINGERFAIGSQGWPFNGKVGLDRSQRLVLYADGATFTFGPVRKMWGDTDYLFVPEDGDVVRFTRDVSRLEWHTPFAFSIMGGPPPKRHRYEYDRLRWTKRSGATLELTWRGEQAYSGAWYDQYNNRLTTIRLRESPLEKTAAAYLSAKGWTAGEYRLEVQAPNAEDDVVHAIFLKDEAGVQPGAGKSVVLRINRSTNTIRETAWQ